MAGSTPRAAYHHGNLRVALIDAGLELAREGGAEAVVLREATRRVGVTAAAAYRHFANREELLQAVSIAARARMSTYMDELMSQVGGSSPQEIFARRVNACGNGYVTFALREQGWFDVAFHGTEGGPEASGDKEMNPFSRLSASLDGLVAAGVLTPERREGVQVMCWAIVHGFVMLVLRGPLGKRSGPELEALGMQMQQEMAVFLRSALTPGQRPELSPGEQTDRAPQG